MSRTTTTTTRHKPTPPPPKQDLIRVAFSPEDLARLLDYVVVVNDDPIVHRLRMRLSRHNRRAGAK